MCGTYDERVGMTSHPAQAITVWQQSGPARNYVRVDDIGLTTWREAETTFGAGAPREPLPDAAALTPTELADLLAGQLE
jgi:hypothetical protein